MADPVVSVVLTNYNGAKYVGEAIKSVLSQTFTDWEMIVVDDASTDSSLEVIRAFQDDRIRLVENEINSQVSFSHNVGNRLCRGKYIAALDNDDVWLPDKLEKQVAYMESHPETGVCFTKLDLIDENGNPAEDSELLALYEVDNRSREDWLRELLINGNHFANDSSLIRREVMQEIGENDLCLVQLHDYDMWVKIARKHDLYIIPLVGMHYRRVKNSNSITVSNQKNIRRTYNEYTWIIGNTILDMGDDEFRKTFWRELIRPDLDGHDAVLCEKAMFLKSEHPLINGKGFAFRLFIDLMNRPETARMLREAYQFTQHDFYRMSAEPISYDHMARQQAEEAERIRSILEKKSHSLAGRTGGLIRKTETRLKRTIKKSERFFLLAQWIRTAMRKGGSAASAEYGEFRKTHVRGETAPFAVSRGEKKIQRQTQEMIESPRFLLMVPADGADRERFKETLQSLTDQTCSKWDLTILLRKDKSEEKWRNDCLKLVKKDDRFRLLVLNEGTSLSSAMREAAKTSAADYRIWLNPGIVLHPSALYDLTEAILREGPDLIYGDEKLFQKKPGDADRFLYKPDFSWEMLRNEAYMGPLVIARSNLWDGLEDLHEETLSYDLQLRMAEKANKIVHIPKVLYARHKEWKETEFFSAGEKEALEVHLHRAGLKGKVEPGPAYGTWRIRYDLESDPLVSIIIPNKDHVRDLFRCVESILRKSSWKRFEILILENNSQEESTFRFYEQLMSRDERIRVIPYKGAFNFAAICNEGAKRARGDFLLLLNNDTEVISEDWIEEMLALAQRKDTGAVGALLFYPDHTVQHGGILLGVGGVAGHAHRGVAGSEKGYMNRLVISQDFSAVTGACMMVPRTVWEQLNGMDEALEVAFNDVDFCLRAREAGFRVLWTPWAKLYHFESKSRGSDDSEAKAERLQKETSYFMSRWASVLEKGDPFYNPNLTRMQEDFAVAGHEGKPLLP